jgi:inosine/xanthosine triphosphate pyrophosphatase family protein
MKDLIFSTGNEAKFIAASEICKQYGINLIQQKVEIDEIQGEEPDKIMLDKTEKAFEKIRKRRFRLSHKRPVFL